jgi:hypothetical protein
VETGGGIVDAALLEERIRLGRIAKGETGAQEQKYRNHSVNQGCWLSDEHD